MKKVKKSSVMKKLLIQTSQDKGKAYTGLISIIAGTLLLSAAPRVAGEITDRLSAATTDLGGFAVSTIMPVLLVLTFMYLVGNAATYITNRNMVRVAQGITRRLRKDVKQKLDRLPVQYLDSHPTGDILSNVTSDVTILSNMLESTVTMMLTQAVTLIFVFAMMFIQNFYLTLIYLVSAGLSLLTLRLIARYLKKLYRNLQDTNGSMNSYINDVYSNHMTMKAYVMEQQSEEKFHSIIEKYDQDFFKSRFIIGFIIPITNFINNFAYIALCLAGGYMLIHEIITLGEFQSFLLYGQMVSSPIANFSTSLNNIQDGLSAAERVFELLAEPEEEQCEIKNHLDINLVQGNVEFKNVVFGYLPERTLFHDVSLLAKPGMRMAVVGPSGAGKTTLVNLLMRFYEIQKGTIEVDGMDIYQMSRENLREAFGMVLQDTWIFDGTIAENIGYGKKNATREEIIEAAKKVRCDEMIRTLQDGYDTHISEEISCLSAGEKQLLAIARTVLADPKILILDEATSQVDTRTEALITEAMEKLMEGRTSFVIAHRLFTIRNSDAIIFMEEGDIKEVGTHEQLMNMNGRYASMYNAASN
ncbi:MAG: ABC transporter ATP-binding protein [bacterium]|nr:ABC transporter ATP-binding protein [bacterium]